MTTTFGVASVCLRNTSRITIASPAMWYMIRQLIFASTISAHYHGNMSVVPLAHSKLTAQGQISVPAKVRQRLGVGPGSVLEWDDEGDRVVVRKAGRFTSEDIHRSLFSKTPRRRTAAEMKAGIRRYIKRRHASR